MKTIAQTRPVPMTTSLHNNAKINDYLLKPLKAGTIGFVTILMLLFFVNLLSVVIGINEKFGMDFLDMLLAGVGFLLQMSGTLLKCFMK